MYQNLEDLKRTEEIVQMAALGVLVGFGCRTGGCKDCGRRFLLTSDQLHRFMTMVTNEF